MGEKKAMAASRESQIVATNRKARHDYHIEETYEAGMVLTGTEVKSIREGRLNLKDSFARIEKGEVYLYNMHVSPYSHGNRWNHEPTRTRKLLLKKGEIRKLVGKVQQEGLTLVPLKVYFTPRGHAKVELALARGKKLWDKRQAIARRDAERQAQRAARERWTSR